MTSFDIDLSCAYRFGTESSFFKEIVQERVDFFDILFVDTVNSFIL